MFFDGFVQIFRRADELRISGQKVLLNHVLYSEVGFLEQEGLPYELLLAFPKPTQPR